VHFNDTEHDSGSFASIIADYLVRIDRGEEVCRETFLAAHPQHVAALRDYFAGSDLIDRLAADSFDSLQAGAAELPRTFGEYELLEEIGRGGMGVVYRARELLTGRLVALKLLLHSAFASSSDVRRFQNEARAAANLNHAGIIPIYHVGAQQGQLFYTMPLLQGGNLAQRIALGPLEPAFAARLLLTVAEAVAVAHQRGIVHRDLKPANILLDEHERPYVADFGLARWLREEPQQITATGELLGTPNYMSPEQVHGHPTVVGLSADVYALGAMLYALLVGQPPFASPAVSDTLKKICDVDPTRPRKIRRNVPRDLETVCLKCLEKSPAKRYSSATELADDLRRFLAGKPLLAQRVSTVERGRRWVVRNPVVGSLLGGIVFALLAGAGFSLHYASQAHSREQEALANLYAADMNLAQQHIRSGAVASATRLLERHQSEPGTDKSRGWEWRHLWHQCHGELRRFEGPRHSVYAATFSPDGQTVAAGGVDRIVWIWETATGKVTHRLEGHTGTVRDLAFAPDGRLLITVGDDGIGNIWNTTTGKRVTKLVGHDRPLTTVAFSPDGCLIATGGKDEPNVNLWDTAKFSLQQSLDVGPAESVAFAPHGARLAIATGDGSIRLWQSDNEGEWKLDTTIRAHDAIVYDVAWSPDGTRLATAGGDRAVKLWDAKTGHELATFAPLNESAYSVSFSPDGRRLVATVRNEPLKVWDIDQPQTVNELNGHTALVTSADFCPDGWRLVSAGEDGTVRLWDSARSTHHDRLEGHLGKVRTVAFGPTGAILASAGAEDSSIILWNPETGQPLRVFRSPPVGINELAFNPDGKYLAAAEGNGHLRVWQVESGQEVRDLALDSVPLSGVAWSPDGKQLAAQAINGTIRMVQADSGSVLATWQSSNEPHGHIAFNEDGSLLLNVGEQFTRTWNVATHTLVHKMQGHAAAVTNAVFNSTGTLIASSSNDHTIRLWDATTGRHVRTLAGHGGTAFGLAFSPDGTRLVSSSTDKTVKLWDVETGLELQSLDGHTAWARDVAFSPDGQHLASAGYDGTIRVWHAANRAADSAATREAAALIIHLSNRFSVRESLVAAIEADKTISDRVRAAAIDQADQCLFYWMPMLAGHRAAERRNWDAAFDAFERATSLAPEDLLHWHWLAMVSIATGRQEPYRRVCNHVLARYRPDSRSHDVTLILSTWLLAAHSEQDLARLRPLIDAHARHFPRERFMIWLYQLRTGNTPREFLDPANPPAPSDLPEGLFVQAMAWHKAGHAAQALVAYQAGSRRVRATNPNWQGELYCEVLRREVEALLTAEPSSEIDQPPGAIATVALPSDSRSGNEAPTSAESRASN
jgi:WD40 repeat protein/serine/threonine protein kinase